jgi:hypothetical protein
VQSDAPKRTVNSEEYRPEVVAALTAAIEREDRELSYHEAAHAIAALANGCKIISVQVSQPPHCSHSSTEAEAFVARLMITIAGEACDGTAPPSKAELLEYLQKARHGTDGRCDGCSIARKLRGVSPATAGDDVLAEVWLENYRQCVAFFAHPDVRTALDKLAAALREHRLLTGEQIAELVDAEALQAARASLETI